MVLQRGSGRLYIPGADGLQNLLVAGLELPQALRVRQGGEPEPVAHIALLPQLPQHLISRGVDDGPVEEGVAVRELPQVPSVGAVVHLVQDGAQLLHQVRQLLLVQLGDGVPDALGLQADAHAVVVPDVLLRQRPDPGALEGHRLHQAHGLQVPDGLPHGALGHPQLLGPIGLDDPVPRIQLSGKNRLPDGVPDLLPKHLPVGDGICSRSRHVQSLHLPEDPPILGGSPHYLIFYYMESALESQFLRGNSHCAQTAAEGLLKSIDYKYLIIDNLSVKL